VCQLLSIDSPKIQATATLPQERIRICRWEASADLSLKATGKQKKILEWAKPRPVVTPA
jgi:hypothetical protein